MDTNRVTADTATLVAAAIARSGLTSSAVATRAGIARTTLLRKIQGRSPFNVAEIAAIAEVVGCDWADLILSQPGRPSAAA